MIGSKICQNSFVWPNMVVFFFLRFMKKEKKRGIRAQRTKRIRKSKTGNRKRKRIKSYWKFQIKKRPDSKKGSLKSALEILKK